MNIICSLIKVIWNQSELNDALCRGDCDGLLCLINKKEKHQSHPLLFVPIKSQLAAQYDHHWAELSAQWWSYLAGNPVFYNLLPLILCCYCPVS